MTLITSKQHPLFKVVLSLLPNAFFAERVAEGFSMQQFLMINRISWWPFSNLVPTAPEADALPTSTEHSTRNQTALVLLTLTWQQTHLLAHTHMAADSLTRFFSETFAYLYTHLFIYNFKKCISVNECIQIHCSVRFMSLLNCNIVWRLLSREYQNGT